MQVLKLDILVKMFMYLWNDPLCFFLIEQKQKKDHVMLLGDSSEDDDGGVPVWQFD